MVMGRICSCYCYNSCPCSYNLLHFIKGNVSLHYKNHHIQANITILIHKSIIIKGKTFGWIKKKNWRISARCRRSIWWRTRSLHKRRWRRWWQKCWWWGGKRKYYSIIHRYTYFHHDWSIIFFINNFISILKGEVEADQASEDQVPSSPRKRRTRKDWICL